MGQTEGILKIYRIVIELDRTAHSFCKNNTNEEILRTLRLYGLGAFLAGGDIVYMVK